MPSPTLPSAGVTPSASSPGSTDVASPIDTLRLTPLPSTRPVVTPTVALEVEPPPEPLRQEPPPATDLPAPAGKTASGLKPVLHVINGRQYAGPERVQDNLAMSLGEYGYQPGFASLEAGAFSRYRHARNAQLRDVGGKCRWNLVVARRIARLVRQEGYALIHAHTPRSLLCSYFASRLANVPLVYHVHNPSLRESISCFENLTNNLLERGCARWADQVITASPALMAQMRSIGVSPDKVRFVPNGTPIPEDDGSIARRRRAPIAPYVVAMVALFRPRKGAELLLNAVAKLRQRDIDVKVEAIGPFHSKDYERRLFARVKKLNLIDHVHWTGFTNNVAAALSSADALVLPSLHSEGMPMVVLEAMASGLPVVASRSDGVSEAVLHGETGLLVERRSPNQLADALEELFLGGVDYPLMSCAARERHAQRFTDQMMASNVAEVYEAALGR